MKCSHCGFTLRPCCCLDAYARKKLFEAYSEGSTYTTDPDNCVTVVVPNVPSWFGMEVWCNGDFSGWLVEGRTLDDMEMVDHLMFIYGQQTTDQARHDVVTRAHYVIRNWRRRLFMQTTSGTEE